MTRVPGRSLCLEVRRLCTAAEELVSSSAASSSSSSPTVVAAASADGASGPPLYRRLSSLGGAPEGSVKKTMDQWVREGKYLRTSSLMHYVKELRKYGRFRHPLELVEWMETRGIDSNSAIHMHLLSKAKGIDFAEDYFNKLPGPAKNQQTYGALLNIYCTAQMKDKALALYETMKQLNYDSNTLAYNNLMSLHVKSGQAEKVLCLLQEMESKKIHKDSFTYNVVITSCAAQGDIEAAERITSEMETKDASKIQWSIYGNLASIYISTGLVEKAVSSLKRLEEIMDKRDRAAYHHLITLFARIGNYTEVSRVWKSLKANMKTTNMGYITFFHALDKLGELDALKQSFEEWEGTSQSTDIRLVNVIIGAFLKKDMVGEAESFLDRAKDKGFEPDHRTFEMFTNYFLRKSDMDSALKNFEATATKLKSWKPEKATVDSFLRCYEEKSDADGAEAFRKILMTLEA